MQSRKLNAALKAAMPPMWRSSITTQRMRIWHSSTACARFTLGEIRREEFLLPIKLSAHGLAIALRLPAPRINDIAREKGRVSPDTALRLARYFGTAAEFWLGLQAATTLKSRARQRAT